jgi:fucose permease
VTGGVIPAAIPGLAERLSVEPASLSPAISALFAGLFVGVALTPLATDHIGAPRGIATGAALQAASLLSLAVTGTTTGVVLAAFAGGVGFGFVEASGAVLSRELQESTGRTLTGLMAITAATAALTPLVVVLAGHGLQYVLTAASVPHALAVVTLNHAGGPLRRDESTAASRTYVSPTRWIHGWSTATFCYVGCETVVAGWSSVLPQATFQLSSSQTAAGTSAFWALLMLGRVTALVALRLGVRALTALAACQLSAVLTLSSAALLAQHHAQSSIILIGLAVCCMGPCYALMLGAAVDEAPEQNAARVARGMVAFGALGGALWAGALSTAAPFGAATVATVAAAGMAASLLMSRKASQLSRCRRSPS